MTLLALFVFFGAVIGFIYQRDACSLLFILPVMSSLRGLSIKMFLISRNDPEMVGIVLSEKDLLIIKQNCYTKQGNSIIIWLSLKLIHYRKDSAVDYLCR